MRFEVLLAGIAASVSAQAIVANQDQAITPPPNLATSLVPAPPVDAQVTDLSVPEVHEELLGPIGGLASAIAHSIETSVLGKVTDTPASELNKLSSSIAGKESQILAGAETAAAEASKANEGGDRKEEAEMPVETGSSPNANDGESDDDEDHDHDKGDNKDDEKRDETKEVGDGGDAINAGYAVQDDATIAGDAAQGAATTGDDAARGDATTAVEDADEANDSADESTDDEEGTSDKGEANLSEPEGLKKLVAMSEGAAEHLVAWTPFIGLVVGAVVVFL